MNAGFFYRRGLSRPLILAGVVLAATCSLSAAVVYDFVQKAPEAQWRRSLSGPEILPWNGPDNDGRGFARHLANAPLEDGQSFALVLETHPEWKNGGAIYGFYYNVSVPANAKFAAKVGFLRDATATDGAVFGVYVVDPSTGAADVLVSKHVRSDGVLDDLSADLGPYAGRTVTFRLQVGAGSSSVQDWAVWASAAVTQEGGLVLARGATLTRVAGAAVSTKATTAQAQTQPQPQAQAPSATLSKPQLANVKRFQPAMMKAIPLIPAGGAAPPKHKIEDYGSLNIDEPRTLLNRYFRDNEKPNTYYYLPREINLIRDEASGDYRVSAVWTQGQKIRTTLALQANIDPSEVEVLREAVKAVRGSSATVLSMPYDEANIIDMKGWEDWQIEDIRIPTFGSLETELPISIAMTPETLAQLKPLLEKEGLTAGMRIKTGDIERPIPIKVGLKYFTGRMYSSVEELGYSYDERASLVTLHGVKNMTDFPLRVTAVNLRFRLSNQAEVYRSLACRPEVTIPPGEAKDVQAQLVMKDILLAEYRSVYPTAPPPKKKKNPLLEKALGILKGEIEKKLDKDKAQEVPKPAETSAPADAKMDDFFKSRVSSYWLDAAPDFDCQECLDKIWGNIEVVSYIERMRKVNVEALANVFDSAAYETPLEVQKLHVEIRTPYLSAQPKDGLMAAVDLNKDKLKDTAVVYLPLATQETFWFEFKVKAILKSGESAESAEWEKVTDSLDLTLGTFHVKKIFQK